MALNIEEAVIRSHATTAGESKPAAGYGRSRLWLGISAVGTFVLLCVAALALEGPAQLGVRSDENLKAQALAIAGFVACYLLVQLPFDFFGGFVLPRRHGRIHPPLPRYLIVLLRGVAVHAVVFWLMAMALTLAGAYGGIVGVTAAGSIGILLLLTFRHVLATLMASLSRASSAQPNDAMPLPTVYITSADDGFTGNVMGIVRPRSQILPARWLDLLDAEALATVMWRRAVAVSSGSWLRGRVLAVLFTLAGLALSSWMVGAEHLGKVRGTIELSLWFSLWSFVGLLCLPTLSRWAVADIDWRAVNAGVSRDLIGRTSRQLDCLQDGEPFRPGIVETIFHTIPSVDRRVSQIQPARLPAFWDVARTSIYLSIAGCGLLGRAVHCNCGRPALWVFLPTD